MLGDRGGGLSHLIIQRTEVGLRVELDLLVVACGRGFEQRPCAICVVEPDLGLTEIELQARDQDVVIGRGLVQPGQRIAALGGAAGVVAELVEPVAEICPHLESARMVGAVLCPRELDAALEPADRIGELARLGRGDSQGRHQPLGRPSDRIATRSELAQAAQPGEHLAGEVIGHAGELLDEHPHVSCVASCGESLRDARPPLELRKPRRPQRLLGHPRRGIRGHPVIAGGERRCHRLFEHRLCLRAAITVGKRAASPVQSLRERRVVADRARFDEHGVDESERSRDITDRIQRRDPREVAVERNQALSL